VHDAIVELGLVVEVERIRAARPPAVIRERDNLPLVRAKDRVDRILDRLAAASSSVGDVLEQHYPLLCKHGKCEEDHQS
jgi:hypothetical protein